MRSQCSAQHHFSFQRIHVIIVLEYSFRISALQQGRKRKIFPLASHRCMNVLVEYSSLLARSRGCCMLLGLGSWSPHPPVIRVPVGSENSPFFIWICFVLPNNCPFPSSDKCPFFMLLIILLQNVPL